MSWIKVRDGYVNTKAIEAIRRANYLYDNKYRLMLDTVGGNTYIANEYKTSEECENQIEKLVNQFLDEEDL